MPEKAPIHERLHEWRLERAEVADAAAKCALDASRKQAYAPPPEPVAVKGRRGSSMRGQPGASATPKRGRRPDYRLSLIHI